METPVCTSSESHCLVDNCLYMMEEEELKENCEERRSPKFEENMKTNTRVESPQIHLNEEHRWQTVTSDSYPAPRSDMTRSLGRRRELVKNFIGLRVFGETMNAMIAEMPPEPSSPSEYVEKFCDSDFVPFMDRMEYDVKKHSKYPLYGGAGVQSYYKSQLDKGSLKSRSEISDFNQPFRRSCSFTTPPDLALREPTGGF